MATLVYTDVDGVDRSFALGAEPATVGRAADCAIRSDDPRVSRVHGRFFIDQGTLWVEDLGSANGIYVGPQKVKRAPVPIGEIILIGSLLLRLLPSSGTVPPPMGLHGTLAQWLEMERKARAGIEEERNAFAERVGQVHGEVRIMREAQSVLQEEERALRAELTELRRRTTTDLEAVRVELAKAKEEKIVATTSAGLTAAERLAEQDMVIAELQKELAAARAQTNAAHDAPKVRDLEEQLTLVTARAERAEKELSAAQIRAQGAERNAAQAATQAASAQSRAEAIQHTLDETDARVTELAGQVGSVKQEHELARLRVRTLDQDLAVARDAVKLTDGKLEATRAELGAVLRKLAAAEARTRELETRISSVDGAGAEVAAARKEREEVREKTLWAEKRVADALAGIEEAHNRASAADTMAKSMAKDVAEALKRAVDADSKARAVSRELDGAHRRAEAAEKRDAEHAAATRDAERRAADAEATLARIEQELSATLDQTQRALTEKLGEVERELIAKADAAQRTLTAKADQAARELAAERSTAMSLVNSKTQIERELADTRGKLAALQTRLEAAEARDADASAATTSAAEAREQIGKLEEQLAEAKGASKGANKTAAALEKRLEALESELAKVSEARATAERELEVARARLEKLERAVEEASTDRASLSTAEQRAKDAEALLEPLQSKADAADLAVGQANALQRQLDEALQKLGWLERDLERAKAQAADPAAESALVQRIADAEARAEEADHRVRDAEALAQEAQVRADEADAHALESESRAQNAETRAREVDARAREIEARAKDIEARAKEAAERIVDVERRARDFEGRVGDAVRRAHDAEERLEQMFGDPDRVNATTSGEVGELHRQLVDAQARIDELQAELEKADNVRQFAAATEREIVSLEREVRELKAKVTQLTLERDRFEAQLRDVRDDSDTTHRRGSVGREDGVGAVDLSRYTTLVARASELEHRVVKMEKEDEKLRRLLQDSEAKLAAQRRAQEDEPTKTGVGHVPVEFIEHINLIEEAIESLRANMRAASDETAVMEQSESVVVVSSAVSAAAEHVERARDSLRVLSALLPQS